MNRILKQLTMLYGAAQGLEQSLPLSAANAEALTREEIQDARDLLIATTLSLQGIESKLNLSLARSLKDCMAPVRPQYAAIIDCALGASPLPGGAPQ